MEICYHHDGIHLPEIDLWLDSTVPCAATWISHGHSDHARGCHGIVIGTETTLRFYRMRLWMTEGDPEPQHRPLEFGSSMDWKGARLTALPAGHILGAAQLLIEHRGERIVYTGDVKLKTPICGADAVVIPCDRLIVESTFGLPIYRLLSKEGGCEQIVRFARTCLAESTVPVFVGYALGRGQEIVHVLTMAGIPTAVHGAIAKFIPAYEQSGYSFDGWEPYNGLAIAGKALVVVPSHGTALEASGKNVRLAYVSGWAALANARTRAGAEQLIPYSDHADFDELVDLTVKSGAKRVDVVHGYTAPFAHILRSRGIDATAPRRGGESTHLEAVEG